MAKQVWVGLVACAVVAAAMLFTSVTAPTTAAGQSASPLPTPVGQADAACRGCHGAKTDVLTLPSGETLPLGVDLAALDASPHSVRNDPSLPCTSCHVNETDYRYPHLENPAQTAHDFKAAVSQNCESCHYPHLPFHETVDQSQYTTPTCADCHGSHDIAHVTDMWETMPDNCVACHTDRSRDWVADFLTPLPGLGAGAEGYGGSLRCAGCHEDKYFSWRETLHADVVQDVQANPDAVIGDFSSDDPARPFALDDVGYTIGSRWTQVYMSRTVSDTFQILPAQWDVKLQEWAPYHYQSAGGENMDWSEACAGCHVTGLDNAASTFKEFGVGCESCHGPAAAHAADPENVKPYVTVDAQVCGACHSRGTSTDGQHPFPVDYTPGDMLADHFVFTTDEEALWPDGSAKLNHQQYMDWQLGSSMSQAPGMSCNTCHAVHGGGVDPGQLKQTSNELCLSCHGDQEALVRHTPFHETAMKQRDFNCTDCHMPLMATSSDQFDIHNHSLLQPNPQGSIDHGGLDLMPNACNNCHNRSGESAEWAAQTIAFAQQQAPPVAGGSFGPGPTPTSPPPPTPMASVGQPSIYQYEVDTGQWVRRILVIAAVFALFLVVAWAYYWIRRRRSRNV